MELKFIMSEYLNELSKLEIVESISNQEEYEQSWVD